MRNKTNHYNFSPRQTQVVRCIIKGLSNKEIAKHLGLSEETVKEYIGTTFRKAQVNNRTALAVKVLRLSQVDVGK